MRIDLSGQLIGRFFRTPMRPSTGQRRGIARNHATLLHKFIFRPVYLNDYCSYDDVVLLYKEPDDLYFKVGNILVYIKKPANQPEQKLTVLAFTRIGQELLKDPLLGLKRQKYFPS